MDQAAQLDRTFDSSRAQQFAERLLGSLNQAAVCLMTSIGHRTGLFDAMAPMPPATSPAIAHKAGLSERYVREWLGAMVTGGVIEHDPATKTYWLPPEHAASLTRQNPADNMAVFAQYIPLLASVEDDIVTCFEKGGGVPYERFPRFHEVMAEDSGQSVMSSLLDHIVPLVPGLARRLEQGIQVLDAGCGRGKALNLLASTYPESTFVGYDLSETAIEHARAEARAGGLNNVRFEMRNLSTFDKEAQPEAFDLVTTFDAVHDQSHPRALLKGIARTLKKDGVFLMQEIHGSSHVDQDRDHPMGPFLYTISCMGCMTVSLAGDGEGLGTMWGREKALELLEEAGLGPIEIKRLDHDIQNDYYIIRK